MLDAGVDASTVEELAVVVSELVSNAIVAADAPVVVRFAVDAHMIRLEVDDSGSGSPQIVEGSERGGFGLQLVDQLTTRWGCEIRPSGKTVWAELLREA